MTEKVQGKGQRALQEFLSEAQDLAENLGKSLMATDEALKTGEPDPDIVNDLFRGMHTLKGLSGMFEVKSLSELAHQEENLLEEVRLGRIPFTTDILDLLFESLEMITHILGLVSEANDAKAALNAKGTDELLQRIERALLGDKGGADAVSSEEKNRDPAQIFAPEVLEVLTEYEEHRLKTNLERGYPFYRICMKFDIDSIDVKLDEIKTKLKPFGEIITYLPSAAEAEPDKLGIDIILALLGDKAQLTALVESSKARIEEIDTKPAGELKAPLPQATDVALDAPAGDIESTGIQEGADQEQAIAPVNEADQALSLRSVSQTVRVDIRKLDHLMNVVGELALIKGFVARVSDEVRAALGRGDLAIEMHRINRSFDRRLVELREGILEVRMVPLSQVFDRLARLVRKISRSLGKEIHLVISGADTEVDKLIIEELSDPLMHIVRNAIDHGVEEREKRIAAGKPDFGTVALTAYQKGNHVMIEIEDDGAGIDNDRLLKVAEERGLVDPDQVDALSARDIINLIFLPGISTKEKTTELSGRGVGMDVVKTNISALGGVVEVQSERGIGTKFSITLPVTLAIIPTLLVVVADRIYAVPLNTVTEAIFVSAGDIRPILGMETTTLRGQTLALCRLDEFFGAPRSAEEKQEYCVVVTSLGQRRLGLVVDALIGQQDVVIKSLGQTLSAARFCSGATDIGNERLALVLDTAVIIEEFFAASSELERRSAAME